MGIMVTNNFERKSDLDRRITSDLRARTQSMEDTKTEFNAEDKDMQQTSKFAWVWIALIILAVISLFCILFI